jgi:hypothetical protein
VRRGSIEHVATKKRVYFEDLADILRFIEEWAGTGIRTEELNARVAGGSAELG